MIQGIHHTGLSTPDLERTVRFYVDLLGFEELTRFDMPPGSRAWTRCSSSPASASVRRCCASAGR